jgi:hypothetical protein
VSCSVGIALEALLFGLCWLTSHDLFQNGPDTTLSVCFARVSLWGGWILKLFADRLSDSSALAPVLAVLLYFILPALVYALIAHALLRRRKLP